MKTQNTTKNIIAPPPPTHSTARVAGSNTMSPGHVPTPPPVALPEDEVTGPRPDDAVPRPKTLTVLAVLMATALAVSYLTAYAGANALVQAELMDPFTAGHDPRPRWLLYAFTALLTTFAAAAVAFRFLSKRQLRSLDAMADSEGEVG
ncbi:MAG TPA: hypothetical protein VK324_12360 [Tepidisphaeraceae bacterium]|nr:hypothetical protein [Tepidisphaeraceae bacterium]